MRLLSGNTESSVEYREQEHQADQLSRRDVLSAAAGFLAIVTWLLLFLLHRLGGLLAIAIVAFAALGVLLLVSVFSRRIADRIIDIGDAVADKSDWVAWFMIATLVAGWGYFLLFAPYGVLCILQLKSCGVW